MAFTSPEPPKLKTNLLHGHTVCDQSTKICDIFKVKKLKLRTFRTFLFPIFDNFVRVKHFSCLFAKKYI